MGVCKRNFEIILVLRILIFFDTYVVVRKKYNMPG